MKLNDDWSLAEVRCHGEIGNGGNHGDGGGDIVEDPVRAWFHEGHANENKGRGSHEGAGRPVPVGAMSGDLKVRATTDSLYIILLADFPKVEPQVSLTVDGKRVITHCPFGSIPLQQKTTLI